LFELGFERTNPPPFFAFFAAQAPPPNLPQFLFPHHHTRARALAPPPFSSPTLSASVKDLPELVLLKLIFLKKYGSNRRFFGRMTKMLSMSKRAKTKDEKRKQQKETRNFWIPISFPFRTARLLDCQKLIDLQYVQNEFGNSDVQMGISSTPEPGCPGHLPVTELMMATPWCRGVGAGLADTRLFYQKNKIVTENKFIQVTYV
jgi:hypothetical protein